MTQYLFMNEQIREEQPDRPVIVLQDSKGRQRESNEFELFHEGRRIGRIVFDRAGLPECSTHDVVAWVELDDRVRIAPPQPLPEAAEKKPNNPINFRLNFRKENAPESEAKPQD